jgi:hypothetical protein
MRTWYGDFAEDAVVPLEFSTYITSGASGDASGTPAQADFTVYKDGVAMTLDASTITVADVGNGMYTVSVDMGNDADFTTGSDYRCAFQPASITVDSLAVEAWVGSWSCQNRYVPPVVLNMAQALPGSPTPDTVGDALKQATREEAPKRGVALNNMPVYLVQSGDHITPATGLTPTVTISQDGGAFASLNGGSSIAEVGSGWYRLNLDATDMDAASIFINIADGAADPLPIALSTVD